MAFAWQCSRCKGPPLKGGASEKPWIGPCPNCGGYYDASRVSIADDEIKGAELQPIKEGEAISLSDAIANAELDPHSKRTVTGSKGLDWVLGGGIPPAIAMLLASPAGCGKSTMLIETFRKLALLGHDVLYCCTEESIKQMGRRYGRLGKFPPKFQVVDEKDLVELINLIESTRPAFAAIDSLHDLEGVVDSNGFVFSTGSGTAVTLAAKMLKSLASQQEMSIFAVAHVTKDGNIAGTNTVQHALDMTLYFNGKQKLVDGRQVIVGTERTLRCDGKNRFSEPGRVAHFSMREDGLFDMGPWTHARPPWEVSVGNRGTE